MNLATFTTDPAGVDASILRRRVCLISASSIGAYIVFFGIGTLLAWAKKDEYIWISVVGFGGFYPTFYAWGTGWVARWKALVFGLLLPAGLWSTFVLMCAVIAELYKWLHS